MYAHESSAQDLLAIPSEERIVDNDLVATPRSILVTGMTRSGTSWVGRMLMSSGQYVYCNEPLNVEHPPGVSPGILDAPVPYCYLYISPDNEAVYESPFRRMLALRFRLITELKRNHNARDLLRAVKYQYSFTRGRLSGRSALVDDPFAVFAAPWLAKRFGMRAVIVVRHPYAIAASRLRLGWTFDFTNLLEQDLLMRDYLQPFRSEMEAMSARDIIGQSALLWKVIYSTVHRFTEKERFRPIIVRHEDLALHPLERFEGLFSLLRLPVSDKTVSLIKKSTSGPKCTGASHSWSFDGGFGKTGYRRLDSRALLRRWRDELRPEDVERIRAIVGDAIEPFYQWGELAQDRSRAQSLAGSFAFWRG
jgi:Sulfotransferase family